MPVTTDPALPGSATAPGGYGITALATAAGGSATRLAALAEAWRKGRSQWNQGRNAVNAEGDRILAAFDQEPADAPPPVDIEAACRDLAASRQQMAARVAKAAANVRRDIRQRLDAGLQALADEPVPTQGPGLLDAQILGDLEMRRIAFFSSSAKLHPPATALQETLARMGKATGVRLGESLPVAATLPSWAPPRLVTFINEEIGRSAARLAEATQGADYRLCTLGGRFALHASLLVPGGLVAGCLHLLRFPVEALWWTAGASVLAQVGAALVVAAVRGRLARKFLRLDHEARIQKARISMIEEAGRREFDPQTHLREMRFQAQAKERAARTDALRAAADKATASAFQRETRLRKRIESGLPAAQDALRRELTRREQERRADRERARAEAEATIARQLAAVDQRWDQERRRVEGEWTALLDGLAATTAQAAAQADQDHPPWDSPSWEAWTPGTEARSGIPVGVARRPAAALVQQAQGKDLPPAGTAEFAAPVALELPGRSSLLVRIDAETRSEALRLANQTILRALTALPANRLKLVLVDPVGLGSAFSGILDLADHDEALIQGGVLVDSGRIERGLDDLIAHLEVVIQKHLRGKYATIDDYNRQAGELQEALRLLVIADFPTGFTDRSLERLGVLLRSGPRCGVHFLILADQRKPLPTGIDLAWFRSQGLVLRSDDGRLTVDQEELADWTFQPAPSPAPALQAGLLAKIGQQSQKVRRIEVAFRTVAPPPEAMWSLSASRHLRVPVGKCGADRLQYFDLGVGTAQHALIGGRTGSGKSTLFHVLVVSAALWYAPREVEFHLIDFKKGVEFKTYATHHLPHARVIAIESDREFGLSVLRNLDQELTRRGDAFRKANAHDLAAYRASGAEYLPRILLLIDEFQEFFTEDDAVARDAALLLDRFVRQGRAFGLHVVLGSQTLGGAYTMARSSIGQMGVRIALPCNENDAHLLLHEENDAARLLSRPGDGIYNDRAGLTEGNSPFQVCWLPEAEESASLDVIAARTAAEGWKPAQRTVVFEGNGPSRLDEETGLESLLAKGPGPADVRLRACVGQASSLNGATHIDLLPAAGGNLLIFGQNREAAAATCGAIALGLAARHPAGGLRLLSLDGEDKDAPYAQLHQRLAACLPQDCVRHEAKGITEVLADLSGLLERRQSGEDTGRTPVVLTVFAIQRLRQLRPDEDGYGRSGDEPASDRFARILANGPEYGIHTIVWCDSLASAQRSLSRRSMRDFDARLLFQMSASDSGELIDDDAASKLGLHTALLSVLSEGRREKFRPFSLPDQAFLDRVAQALRARAG